MITLSYNIATVSGERPTNHQNERGRNESSRACRTSNENRRVNEKLELCSLLCQVGDWLNGRTWTLHLVKCSILSTLTNLIHVTLPPLPHSSFLSTKKFPALIQTPHSILQVRIFFNSPVY